MINKYGDRVSGSFLAGLGQDEWRWDMGPALHLLPVCSLTHALPAPCAAACMHALKQATGRHACHITCGLAALAFCSYLLRHASFSFTPATMAPAMHTIRTHTLPAPVVCTAPLTFFTTTARLLPPPAALRSPHPTVPILQAWALSYSTPNASKERHTCHQHHIVKW